MPIVKPTEWKECVAVNDGPYGGACVKVARRVMEILDAEAGDFDCHAIICRADRETNTGGITGFMAGAVASMVSKYHSRGEEFRLKWNAPYGVSGEKANSLGGVVNPAIITIGGEEEHDEQP